MNALRDTKLHQSIFNTSIQIICPWEAFITILKSVFNEDIELNELSPLFGSAPANEGNCYLFKIDKQYQNKNIIISTTLFNGNGNLKIGGWEKVKDMKVKKEEKYNYPIISDKLLIIQQKKKIKICIFAL